MTAPPRSDPQSFDLAARTFVRIRELNADIDGITPWLRRALPGGATALDVGCGAGEHTTVLAEHYDEVLGIDISASMLALAPAHERVAYEQRDLFDVTGEFDLVLTVNTLHHVDVAAALRQLRTLVAPGGMLVVVDCVRVLPSFLWNPLTIRAMHVVDLARDLVRRRPHAWERFRVANHPAWVAHLASDRYPTGAEWRSMIDAELPGAQRASVPSFFAMTWVRSSPQL